MKFKLQMVAVEADGKENNVQEITLLGEYKKRGARLPIYDLEAHADQSLICRYLRAVFSSIPAFAAAIAKLCPSFNSFSILLTC